MHILEALRHFDTDEHEVALERFFKLTPKELTKGVDSLSSFFHMDIQPGNLYYIPMGFITLDFATCPLKLICVCS